MRSLALGMTEEMDELEELEDEELAEELEEAVEVEERPPQEKAVGLNGYGGPDEEEEEAAARDQGLLQDKCLPVSGAPMPPSASIPESADEYLRQVQWERMHCAGLVDVEVKEKKKPRKKQRGSLFGNFQPADELPEALRPRPDWAEDTARAFRAMRAQCDVARLAAASAKEPSRLSLAEWRRRYKDPPSTELLAAQDFVSIKRIMVISVQAMVSLHKALVGEAISEGEDEVKLDIPRLDLAASWAFSAMAFIEEPLIDDIQYEMQRLRRSCQKVLAAHDGASEMHVCARDRARLLLVIIMEVFGQR